MGGADAQCAPASTVPGGVAQAASISAKAASERDIVVTRESRRAMVGARRAAPLDGPSSGARRGRAAQARGRSHAPSRWTAGRSEERRVGKECRSGWAGGCEMRKREVEDAQEVG